VFSLSKNQYTAIVITLIVVVAFTVLNLRISLRRSRDVQRKQDVRNITDLLNNFREEHAYFPLSDEGKIVGCDTGLVDKFDYPIFRSCEWGNDNFVGSPLPEDPQGGRGVRYYYLSSGAYYQVYASLEGSLEAEYDPKIVARNILCGNKICNFGLAWRETPLDKSIDEYENELRKTDL